MVDGGGGGGGGEIEIKRLDGLLKFRLGGAVRTQREKRRSVKLLTQSSAGDIELIFRSSFQPNRFSRRRLSIV